MAWRLLTAAFAGLLALPVALAQGDASLVTREAIAPTGTLRIGLYRGSPTSLLGDETKPDARGVGHDLAIALAQELHLPYKLVVFANNADVLGALQGAGIDIAFTNATPERARTFDFSPVCLEIELGMLARKNSPVNSLSDFDRPGVRLGVTAKSNSDAKFTRDLHQASLVRAGTLQEAVALMAKGEIDVYATNKPTLFELSDQLPGSRVLDGNWGAEHMALTLPKGREGAVPYLAQFVAHAREKGLIDAAVARAGLRGVAP